MKEAVRTVEGTPMLRLIEGEAQATLPGAAAPSNEPSSMPMRVYSLDGLLALALAVQQLETSR